MTADIKPYKGIGMNGQIATWYAKNTRRDMAEFKNLASRLARETPAPARVLEVAPGPGYLAIELAKLGPYEITGLDISEKFVQIASDNAREESVPVTFQQGDASAMPFPDNTFNLIVCRAAFKNFSRPDNAINEMFRVLQPGGRALIIDLRKDASLTEIDAYVKNLDVGWLNSFMIKLTFRCMLIPRAYSTGQIKEMSARSKFGKCEITTSAIGFELVLKK